MGGKSVPKVLQSDRKVWMTNWKRQQVTFVTKYLRKVFVQRKMIEMNPMMCGMIRFLSEQTHQTGSLTMLILSVKRLKCFSLIP
jgi:hypothetical protein